MKKLFLSLLLVIVVLPSEAQVVKTSSLETLEKFSIVCSHFRDGSDWEKGGETPIYFNFKSKDQVTIFKYHNSIYLDPDKPEKLIYKNSAKYFLSLRSLRIDEDVGSYTINRATLEMRSSSGSGSSFRIHGPHNCEIIEKLFSDDDLENIMRLRINRYIQEIKNKNKY